MISYWYIGDNILDGGTGQILSILALVQIQLSFAWAMVEAHLAAADTIADFTDGSDVLGLDGMALLY